MQKGRDDIIKRFLESGRTGFYFSVIKEGEVGAGDPIEIIHTDVNELSVAGVTRLYLDDEVDLASFQKALRVEALPQSWKDYFERLLAEVHTVG